MLKTRKNRVHLGLDSNTLFAWGAISGGSQYETHFHNMPFMKAIVHLHTNVKSYPEFSPEFPIARGLATSGGNFWLTRCFLTNS